MTGRTGGQPRPGLNPFRAVPRGFSRRAFIQAAGLGSTAAMLAACGISPARPGTPTVPDRSDTERFLNWSNWQGYMDVSEDDPNVHPTLDQFREKTGIEVIYTEDVNDNIDYFSKIHPQIVAGQTITADVFVVTDWMVSRLISLGYVEQFDHANMPNMLANIAQPLIQVPFDIGRNYSATWQSGLTGIATNPVVTDGMIVETIDQLLNDKTLAGRITVLTEMRDTVGLVLSDLGYNPTDFTDSQFNESITVIGNAVNSGQIRQFTGNDYTQGLASGDLAAAIAWSGDVVILQADAPDIQLTLPEAGFNLWSDNFVIPAACAHKKNVEELINFYYEPDIAAEIAIYVNYVTPVPSSKEVVVAQDPELADNQLIFPSEETLSKAKVFMNLDAATEARYQKQFNKLTGA